jgi:hypothetical protein
MPGTPASMSLDIPPDPGQRPGIRLIACIKPCPIPKSPRSLRSSSIYRMPQHCVFFNAPIQKSRDSSLQVLPGLAFKNSDRKSKYSAARDRSRSSRSDRDDRRGSRVRSGSAEYTAPAGERSPRGNSEPRLRGPAINPPRTAAPGYRARPGMTRARGATTRRRRGRRRCRRRQAGRRAPSTRRGGTPRASCAGCCD